MSLAKVTGVPVSSVKGTGLGRLSDNVFPALFLALGLTAAAAFVATVS